MTPLLDVAQITAWYGRSQALFGVDLSVGKGEVLALLGRNGMGKSTTIRTICRMMPNRTGTIRFAGHDLSTLKSYQAARLGIGLVPEGRRCFANLTVAENLTAAARPGDWGLGTIGQLFPRLAERRTQKAHTLSGGEQQMLAISRALMTNPSLLILDEATEGLAPTVRKEIWSAISGLKTRGQSILVVDKGLSDLLRVADRCVILEKGQTAWTGPPTNLTDQIANRYLGV